MLKFYFVNKKLRGFHSLLIEIIGNFITDQFVKVLLVLYLFTLVT